MKIVVFPLILIFYIFSYSSVSVEKFNRQLPFGGIVDNTTIFFGKKTGDISLRMSDEKLNGSFTVSKDSSAFLFVIYSLFGAEIARINIFEDSLKLSYGEQKLISTKSEGINKFPIIGNYPFTIDELTRILFGLPLFSDNEIIENGEIKKDNGNILFNAIIEKIYLRYIFKGRRGRSSCLYLDPIYGNGWKLRYTEPRKGFFKKVELSDSDGNGFVLRFDR